MLPNKECKLNVSKSMEPLLNGTLGVSIVLALLGSLRKVNEPNRVAPAVPAVPFLQSTSLKLCQMLKDLTGGLEFRVRRGRQT